MNLKATLVKPSFYMTQQAGVAFTEEQQQLLTALDDFVLDKATQKSVFLLRGYAGTGKTLLVGLLVEAVRHFGYKVNLLAPTGRAAKVLAQYAQKAAFTIHKRIYRQSSIEEGQLVFQKVVNTNSHTLYVVDEASMISDKADYGQRSLLADLISYVFIRDQQHNKLLFIGDTAQLPPVGSTESPALEESYLAQHYDVQVKSFQLTQVMRQAKDTGILWNATLLRKQLAAQNSQLGFRTKGFKDFYRMTADRLEEGLRYAYDQYGVEQTIVICRSNKNANNFNHYIRRSIRFCETEIESGDLLMIVKNNYTILPAQSAATFLANGDFVEVLKIQHLENLYGFRFATLTLRLLDEPKQAPFEAKVLLDVLHSNTPALSREDYQRLYEQVSEDYQDITQKKKRNEALKKDPYLNALQVKFAYALTCHKSQGGQWEAVFVEQGYLPEGVVDADFIRWLYTAVTRASKMLFLVNFQAQFFE